MKHFKQGQIAVFFLLLLFWSAVQGNENPSDNKNEKQLELENIPANRVLITLDSSVYQHNEYWQGHIDSNAYDSLAATLTTLTE